MLPLSHDHDLVALVLQELRVLLRFCHEGAGQVDDGQPVRLRTGQHIGRYAMGADDQRIAWLEQREILDRRDPRLAQPCDLLGIVDERAETVDLPRAGRLEGRVDGPLDAEAETRLVRQDHFHETAPVRSRIWTSIISTTCSMVRLLESR